MNVSIVRYQDEDGKHYIALAVTGRRTTHLVFLRNRGVTASSIPNDKALRWCSTLRSNASNIRHVAAKLRKTGKTFGITKTAERLLRLGSLREEGGSNGSG